MQMAENKICKTCYKEIDSRAKKCPYCHQVQGFWGWFFWPGLGFAIVMLMIYLPIAVWMQRLMGPGKRFAEYRNQIKISNPQITFSDSDKCGMKVVVLLTIANSSEVDWQDLQFNAIFSDANGVVFDADQDKKFAMALDAKDSSRIKISFPREFAKERYKSVEVKVTHATQAGKI
jgi:hypothetical protein